MAPPGLSPSRRRQTRRPIFISHCNIKCSSFSLRFAGTARESSRVCRLKRMLSPDMILTVTCLSPEHVFSQLKVGVVVMMMVDQIVIVEIVK